MLSGACESMKENYTCLKQKNKASLQAWIYSRDQSDLHALCDPLLAHRMSQAARRTFFPASQPFLSRGKCLGTGGNLQRFSCNASMLQKYIGAPSLAHNHTQRKKGRKGKGPSKIYRRDMAPRMHKFPHSPIWIYFRHWKKPNGLKKCMGGKNISHKWQTSSYYWMQRVAKATCKLSSAWNGFSFCLK